MNSAELLNHYGLTGEEDAFAELLRRHGGWVTGVISRRLGDHATAEDAVQTVFIRLAQNAPRFSHDAELVAWLHRTAMGVAVDHWRSENRRRHRETIATMDLPKTAVSEASENELLPIIDDALDQLPDVDRQAVLMRFFEGRSMRDLGVALGVSEDAAKMRISRAVERLRAGFLKRGLACSGGAVAKALGGVRSVTISESQVARILLASRSCPTIADGAHRGVVSAPWLRRLGWGVTVVGVGLLLSVAWLKPAPAPTIESSSETGSVSMATASGSSAERPSPASASGRVVRQVAGGVRMLESTPYADFQVVDVTTGDPVAGALVEAAYFFAGGESEGEVGRTDSGGRLILKGPRQVGDRGANVFVTAEQFVPSVVNLVHVLPGESRPYQRRLLLDRALTVGGRVVDEHQEPVGGVEIRLEHWGGKGTGGYATAFHHRAAYSITDPEGRWVNTFVPSDLETIKLQVTHESYAATLAEVPTRGRGATNAVLVLRSGTVAEGLVVDEQGHPVIRARIREYHNFTYATKSTETDSEGRFHMSGLGMTWLREGRVDDRPRTMVVVEAPGFAPQKHSWDLTSPVISCHFVLRLGKSLRGRVADEQGNPIVGALVRTDADSDGLRPYVWMTHTQSDGGFTWLHAPSEPVLCWFEADGFEWRRDVPLVADDAVHEIRLSRVSAP